MALGLPVNLAGQAVNDPEETTWLLLDTASIPPGLKDDRSSCFTVLCNPNRRPYRYTVALFAALIQGVLSFCCDFPAGIQSTMIKVMNLDDTQYNLVFSGMMWPDIVMSILGTVLVDKYLGMRKGIIIFCSIIFIGQLVASIGAYFSSFVILLLGRVLLGCGMGTAYSLCSAFLILWFGGKEITFVMSLGRCFHRLNATLALVAPQLFYDALSRFGLFPSVRHGTTQMLCTLMCLLCVVCATAVAFLDWRGARIIGRKPFPKRDIKIINILTFSTSFWILIAICSVYYAVVSAFTANAPLFFISKYGFSENVANIANSLSYLAIMFVTPFVALFIDLTGYNLIWAVVGILSAITANLIFIFTSDVDIFAPYLAAVFYSFSYTFVGSALWVAPGYLVPKHQLSTAYGTLMSVYALTCTLVNISSGMIVDSLGYLMLTIFYLLVLVVILLLNNYLSLFEIVSGKRLLNVSGKSRMTS